VLKVYGIIRLCNHHESCTTCGPPIGIYYSYDKAYKVLRKWKREHSWDKVDYMIKAYEVTGDFPILDNTLYGVIRLCDQDHFGSAAPADCGPMIGVYSSKDYAQSKINQWVESHSWDASNYVIRKLKIKGDRRRIVSNFYLPEKRYALDI
jgi:hypothetical protein